MHPFGEEEEASMRCLFKFFCECLERGDWVLARACIPQLHHWSGDGAQQVEDLLRAMVAVPSMLRCDEEITPQRLAWFWLIALEKWLSWDQKPLPAFLRSETEFLLLMEELQDQVPEVILKEFYEAFLYSHSELVDGRKDADSYRLSLEASSSLQNIIFLNPRLAQAIVGFLLVEEKQVSGAEYNHSLQKIFIDFLLDALKSLQETEGDSEFSQEGDARRTADLIYSVLSVLPVSMEHQCPELRRLCLELFDACWDEESPLSERRLLGCMVRKQNCALISLYGLVSTERMKEKLLGQRTSEKVYSEQFDTERAVLALFSDPERIRSWKRVFFYCLSSGKHFLEQVLVTAIALMKKEDFSALRNLLKNEFKPLSRLLLLLGWTHCQSLESAKFLLCTLHQDKDLCSDSVLKDFCDGLLAQVELLEWCIKQNSIAVSKRELLRHLHSLDCHSALYFLHHLTNLPALNEDQVVKLLQKAPASRQEAPDSSSKLPTNLLVQRRNLVLFQAFCAMKYAIYALCVNAHKHSACKECLSSLLSQHIEESGLDTEARRGELHCQDYPSLFKHYLAKCKHFLHMIPAWLRLEVLENIFSLLFISFGDLCSENMHPEDYAFEEDENDLERKSDGAKSLDSSTDRIDRQMLSSPSGSPQHEAVWAHRTDFANLCMADSENQSLFASEGLEESICKSYRQDFLDLKHFTCSATGFLVDEVAISAFLELLTSLLEEIKNYVPWDSSKVSREELELLDCLHFSVGKENFMSRLLQFSKVTSEAQWRYKVVMSNLGAEKNLASSRRLLPRTTKRSNLRRRSPKNKTDYKEETQQPMVESTSGELSTSTSEGSTSTLSGKSETQCRPQPPLHSLLIPMMLSPPESLLISCILRENFIEAHQVAIMFSLESSACYSELPFMECYQEVVKELTRVEQKIENQSLDISSRRSGGGCSTLQAIGNAAAAGMVCYSISDVTDKLLAVSGGSLQEEFWLSSVPLEKTDPLRDVLEGLSSSAMAAFDLACTQCQLWKTCKQLLDTAERRLHSSLESRGHRLDTVFNQPYGIQGFPTFLQQISKILNYLYTSQGQSKLENTEEKISSHFRCNIIDLLQSSYQSLTDDCIANEITLSRQLNQILQKLTSAIDSLDPKGNLIASLVEQASLKPHDLQVHPVRTQMKLLLKNLDQSIQTMRDQDVRPDYLRSFFDYINTLAAVLIRSLNAESDQPTEVKVGNPFILLQQRPSQLLSQLLFERQVPPERLSSLLKKEELNLSVQQVIISYCCEPLPLCSRSTSLAHSLSLNIISSIQECVQLCLPDAEILIPNPVMDTAENITSPVSSMPADSNQYTLTASVLDFLKSQSKLIAALACLSACRVQRAPKLSLSWKEFRGSKREPSLDMEQISKECEILLQEFPILQSFLMVMSEPFRCVLEEESSSGSALCGKPCVSLVISGLNSCTAIDVLTQAFQQAVMARDWSKALMLLDLYGHDINEFSNVRDAVLCCAAAEDDGGWRYLFAVKDATLRSKLALCFLENWPLDVCLEILAYAISEPAVLQDLKLDLQNKQKEMQVYHKILHLQEAPAWDNWQDLKKDCAEHPQTIMDIILQAKDYALCEDWCVLYPVPRELLIGLHREHLLHLLKAGDTQKALQLLLRIGDSDMRLAVSLESLDQHPGMATCHFLADYLIGHFHKDLLATRLNEIQAVSIGSKMLMVLPESACADYEHLASRPLLILEQLLMNMKVDWAAIAVQMLYQLLAGQEAGFTTEDIDNLLTTYAGKALDFPDLYRERERRPGVIRFKTPQTLKEKGLRRNKSAEFVPPEKAPTKTEWVPDEMEVACMVCKSGRFTVFNRRHHCRRCGRLVCSSCSTNRMVVDGFRENPARVCDQCYSYCANNTQEEDPGHAEEIQAEESLDLAEVMQLFKTASLQWRLTLNEEENEIERNEFYYEQAPSASLCTAILNLHSDSITCGHQLIQRCCLLSRSLTNPEMDSRLLLDIIKTLLFSAKMMFVKTGRTQDLALCDSYFSKLDLLKILLAATYRYIPSLDEIFQPAAVIKLRNRLLEAEYYQLAVEVSTKTGLDPNGVWHAWGLACLKVDDLTGARSKLSRCLRVPYDLNQLNQGSRLLQDVIQYLESAIRPILPMKDDGYFATLKELEASLNTHSLWSGAVLEGKIQNNTYYKECLFYLHTYGTNLAIIAFYMRQDCMKEALLHLLNKDCPGDIFIDGIFVPSYEKGKLHLLENLLEDIDPSLEKFSIYLIAACKHLQQKNYYNTLYELQQFMKDHVRAAMTCIRFFTHRAKSYSELGGELKWLIKSRDHLKTSLQESTRSFGRRKSMGTFRKKMAACDISRHINTVELQIDVTKFLHRCESAGTSHIIGMSPPTLFGLNPMKMDVACMVMLGGKNVVDGFGLAFRIIQDFQLDAATVYNKASKHLMKQHHYSEIQQLLKCVSESGIAAADDCDNIILNCIQEIEGIPSDELDKLIQSLRSIDNKIKACLACSRLRSAYLISVKLEQERAVQLVQDVLQAATEQGDEIIRQICSKWLSEHQTQSKAGHTQSSRK
ncbi:zinc finger FYVE domain-containing protein 26 isoform X2 [Rhinatrema bivittatum]|uniref:zinc finger FYVE domain-containing protein 26 isoform X2 n=1 Tax=Rhinatrema bivittatum TaxID=194408 RepID=UPI0011276784|nr:zinc finger FYVE domain-containing protein 26 isoform X2 [Rhinatrema bivittatum]